MRLGKLLHMDVTGIESCPLDLKSYTLPCRYKLQGSKSAHIPNRVTVKWSKRTSMVMN